MQKKSDSGSGSKTLLTAAGASWSWYYSWPLKTNRAVWRQAKRMLYAWWLPATYDRSKPRSPDLLNETTAFPQKRQFYSGDCAGDSHLAPFTTGRLYSSSRCAHWRNLGNRLEPVPQCFYGKHAQPRSHTRAPLL